jgi:AcrR family transcriptional regulator
MGKTERQEREREFRVNTILEVANELFNEKGYSATTLEEIADKAELGRATLYYYFKNKEEIYVKVLEKNFNQMIPLYLRGIDFASPFSEQIRSFLKVHAEHYLINRKTFILFYLQKHRVYLKLDKEQSERLTAKTNEFFKIILKIFRKGVEEERIEMSNAYDLAKKFWALVMGITFQQETNCLQDSLFKELVSTVDIFLRGVNSQVALIS